MIATANSNSEDCPPEIRCPGQDGKRPQIYGPVAELVYATDLKSVLVILRGLGSSPSRATSGNISSLHVVPLE